MSTYTELKDRDPGKRQLTEREAWEMRQAGFRFSIFDPTTDTHELSAPLEMRVRVVCETVTFGR